ncbi:glycoside hydrolase family 28 protein [Silvibacterium sp.]|uniref:glycoside hydrolase family 28 protein n=1 Tax=Silvibacterium sp. TaxID=1964179 RepID=UPI0039E2D01A
MSRRTWMKAAAKSASGFAAAGVLQGVPLAAFAQQASAGKVWDPRRFGAVGDGAAKDTQALQRAIDTCAATGGGVVSVSPGRYLTGTVILKSNVELNLQAGAVLLGSQDERDYALSPEARAAIKGRVEEHLIFAFQQQNIAITGQGTIDGQARPVPNGTPEPGPEWAWKEVEGAHWKLGHFFSPMVELAECKQVRLEGVTLQNAAGWTLRPIACDTVLIRGIKIRNSFNIPNSDGIDPTACQNVRIIDCDIVTGDDAICLKAFNPYGATPVSRNIEVSNCRITTTCNGFKVGIEGFGGFENIVFRDSQIISTAGQMNERAIGGITIAMADNGWIDGVTVSNISLSNVRGPILVRLQNSYKDKTVAMAGRLSNVKISNVRATGAEITSSITGLPGFPVKNVTLENVRIETSEQGQTVWASNQPGELPNGGPESKMFGRLPVFGLYCRHAEGITLNDVHFHSSVGDPRPALSFEDVNGLVLTDVDASGTTNAQQLVALKNVQHASIQHCVALEPVETYAVVSGTASQDVAFLGNDLRKSRTPVRVQPDVPANAVKVDSRGSR